MICAGASIKTSFWDQCLGTRCAISTAIRSVPDPYYWFFVDDVMNRHEFFGDEGMDALHNPDIQKIFCPGNDIEMAKRYAGLPNIQVIQDVPRPPEYPFDVRLGSITFATWWLADNNWKRIIYFGVDGDTSYAHTDDSEQTRSHKQCRRNHNKNTYSAMRKLVKRFPLIDFIVDRQESPLSRFMRVFGSKEKAESLP